MSNEYKSPEMDVKEQANFENVFTYCDKGNAHAQGCVNISGSGNAADQAADTYNYAAFSGGGSDGGAGSGL
jgi:hypothetical protein